MPLRLTSAQRTLLQAMREGAVLKVHRTLDGAKEHRLHPLSGDSVPVDRAVVEALLAYGLIASNMKFPAASFLLTEKGVEQAL